MPGYPCCCIRVTCDDFPDDDFRLNTEGSATVEGITSIYFPDPYAVIITHPPAYPGGFFPALVGNIYWDFDETAGGAIRVVQVSIGCSTTRPTTHFEITAILGVRNSVTLAPLFSSRWKLHSIDGEDVPLADFYNTDFILTPIDHPASTFTLRFSRV